MIKKILKLQPTVTLNWKKNQPPVQVCYQVFGLISKIIFGSHIDQKNISVISRMPWVFVEKILKLNFETSYTPAMITFQFN